MQQYRKVVLEREKPESFNWVVYDPKHWMDFTSKKGCLIYL
jgi:hypothetical protein